MVIRPKILLQNDIDICLEYLSKLQSERLQLAILRIFCRLSLYAPSVSGLYNIDFRIQTQEIGQKISQDKEEEVMKFLLQDAERIVCGGIDESVDLLKYFELYHAIEF